MPETPPIFPLFAPNLYTFDHVVGIVAVFGVAATLAATWYARKADRRANKPMEVAVSNFPSTPSMNALIKDVTEAAEREFRAVGKWVSFSLCVGSRYRHGNDWSAEVLEIDAEKKVHVRLAFMGRRLLAGSDVTKGPNNDTFVMGLGGNETLEGKTTVIALSACISYSNIWAIGITDINFIDCSARFHAVYVGNSVSQVPTGTSASWGDEPLATVDYGVQIDLPKNGSAVTLPAIVRGRLKRHLPATCELWLFTVESNGFCFWPQGKAIIDGSDWSFKVDMNMAPGQTIKFQMFILGRDGVLFAKLYRRLNSQIPDSSGGWEGVENLTWDTRAATHARTLYIS